MSSERTIGNMEARVTTLERFTTDHESRLRKLERVLYLVIGGVGIGKLLLEFLIK